ncbi:MAG: hypothetical protein M3R70_02485 [Actinomycetota bacterium]|nr:hypothetical protein [Actinomycetota bacterium]
MYIFISDLHLMDGTAGYDFVDAGVFASTMNDIAAHAREADATELTIVFLGDVYDLWRTERWYQYPLEARPWGDAPSLEALEDIFEGVVAANADTFEILSGSLADRFDFPVEPERIFVPGNHDRLTNDFPSLRRRVRETLGMNGGDGEELFPHHVFDEEHGVFARHGHEWDPFSFGGSATLDAGDRVEVPHEDYMQTAIGDPMAGEFATRLAPLVVQHLGRNHPSAEVIADRMRAITDVRPVAAAMQWAAWQATQFADTESEAINESISEAARMVREIPFVQRWIDANDTWGMDRADMFQALTRCLSSFELLEYERVLRIVDEVSTNQRDIDPEVPSREFARLDSDPDIGPHVHFLLYGHTHSATQEPIGVIGERPNERFRMYFNTGTWRPVHRPLPPATGGFASWRELTYVLVFRPGETVSGGGPVPYPAAESWTGTVVGPVERRLAAKLSRPSS